MKVRLIGIAFEIESIITMDELMSFLVSTKSATYKLGEHSRMVFINKDYDEKYYTGVLITIKDQKKFCELANDDGTFKIEVNELEENHHIMDFNFFVINKKTGFCLYQHYHQSCSANLFGYFMKKRYLSLRDFIIKSKTEAAGESSASKEKAIRKKHAGKFMWQILVRKENLQAILNSLEKIKSFEFDFMNLESKEKEYEPLSSFVKKERRKFSFIANTSGQILATKISSIIDKVGLSSGRVVGEDGDGIERVINIMDNPDNFGEYEYDDVAEKLNSLNLNKFENSWVIDELLAKCNEYGHIFNAKAK